MGVFKDIIEVQSFYFWDKNNMNFAKFTPIFFDDRDISFLECVTLRRAQL